MLGCYHAEHIAQYNCHALVRFTLGSKYVENVIACGVGIAIRVFKSLFTEMTVPTRGECCESILWCERHGVMTLHGVLHG